MPWYIAGMGTWTKTFYLLPTSDGSTLRKFLTICILVHEVSQQ